MVNDNDDDNDIKRKDPEEREIDPYWDSLVSNPELREAYNEAEREGYSTKEAHAIARIEVFGVENARQTFAHNDDEEVFNEVLNDKYDEQELGKRYQSIIEFLSPPDGTPASTAKLEKELEGESDDIHEVITDLIAFGELELVNASQHGRVRLRQPTPSTKTQASLADLTEYVWHAYITERDGVGRTRARRLFSDRETAEEHLKQITNVETLTPVPGITDVWSDSIGSKGYTPEYAVLRREPVFQQADDPYPESR